MIDGENCRFSVLGRVKLSFLSVIFVYVFFFLDGILLIIHFFHQIIPGGPAAEENQ